MSFYSKESPLFIALCPSYLSSYKVFNSTSISQIITNLLTSYISYSFIKKYQINISKLQSLPGPAEAVRPVRPIV